MNYPLLAKTSASSPSLNPTPSHLLKNTTPGMFPLSRAFLTFISIGPLTLAKKCAIISPILCYKRKMLSTSCPPLATTPLLSLYGKTPKNIINAGSFHFLSSHSPLNTLQLSLDPQNSIATPTSTLLHPMVHAPVFTLRYPSAACDLVNASS